MTFENLKGLALGRITVEELSQELIQKFGEVSKAEATTIAQGIKAELETVISEGDDALDARIQTIETSLAEGGEIFNRIQAINTQVQQANIKISTVEGSVSTLQSKVLTVEGTANNVKSELTQFKEYANGQFNTLHGNYGNAMIEIGKLKEVVSGKNNATQVFATMEEFKQYNTEKAESLLKGDMAYVISVKKSYIYNPGVLSVAVLDDPTPPEGWVFFDEISSEIDLAEYAKKTDLDAKADAIHTHEMADVNGLDTALAGKAEATHNHAIAEVTGLQDALDAKLEAADLSAIEGKVDANVAAIAKLNAGQESEGSVDYKIKQVKDALDAVDAGLRSDVDKAKEDILANAEEIAKLTASKFILTRKQELVDAVDQQTVYELAGAGVSENFIVDVFVNSVRLVEGVDKDYTLSGKTLTLKKARSVGSVIQVLFTFISDAPQA